jgi:hypothetical protein
MSIIKNFDMIGINPSLFINGSNTHKTFFGGILSVLSTFLILAGFGYFTNSLFSRSNFSIMQNDETNTSPYIDWSNPRIAFKIVNRTFGEIPNLDKIAGIFANYWYYDTPGGSLLSREILLEPCNVSVHFPDNQDLWENKVNGYTCVARNQSLPVRDTFGTSNYTGMVFWIHKCINNINVTNCATDDIITSTLNNVFVNLQFQDIYLDHHLPIPAIPYIFSDNVQASLTVYKRTWYMFRNIEYYSDDSLFIPEDKQLNYFNFASLRDSTDLRTNPTVPGTFYAISINNANSKQKIYRKYYKLQNMIADLGGIIKALLLAASVINYIFCKWTYLEELINYNINHYPKNHTNKNKDIIVSKLIRKEPCSPSKEIQSELRTETKNEQFFTINKLSSTKLKFNVNGQEKPQRFYKEHITLSFWSLLCSFISSDTKKKAQLNRAHYLQNIIYRQLDVKVLLNKINMTDKLTYVIVGEKYYSSFYYLDNPYIMEEEITPRVLKEENENSDINFGVYISRNMNKFISRTK